MLSTVINGGRKKEVALKNIILFTILIVLVLSGCQGQLDNSSNIPNPENVVSFKEATEESQSTTVEKEYEEVHILPLDITLDDQKEVEELIYDYFNALEHKDYLKSWELMSTNYKSGYKDFGVYDNVQQNSTIESIKLIGIKGFIPPYKTEEFITTEVPEGVPTIWFEAYFDLKLSTDDPIYVNGKNERFVIVEIEDGVWKIGGLASSP
jgi:hypothetical protein